jgi:hypothetical protein
MTLTPRPEQEQLIAQAIQAGLIRNAEDALDIAVDTLRERLRTSQPKRPSGRKSLAQLFADSPLKGLNLTFERDPDTGRHVELK